MGLGNPRSSLCALIFVGASLQKHSMEKLDKAGMWLYKNNVSLDVFLCKTLESRNMTRNEMDRTVILLLWAPKWTGYVKSNDFSTIVFTTWNPITRTNHIILSASHSHHVCAPPEPFHCILKCKRWLLEELKDLSQNKLQQKREDTPKPRSHIFSSCFS